MMNIQPIRFVFCLIVVLLCMEGCGVKEAPSSVETNLQVPPASLPEGNGGSTPIEGVLLTEGKKFLVKPSRLDFKVDPQFKVTYQMVDKNLEDLKPNFTLKVRYYMPDMPKMPVTPAKIERVETNKFMVIYDISMEGKWDFTLSFEEDSQVIDTAAFKFEVLPVL